MGKSYPTRNGLAISTRELDLPRSELNPADHRNQQNHHLYYYSPRYKGHIILNSLRDLEMNQERLARDQHILGKLALHNVYTDGVPIPPLNVAMDRLEMAYETAEQFKVWDKGAHGYVKHTFTKRHWERLKKAYELQGAD